MSLLKKLLIFFLFIFLYYQSWIFKSIIFLLFSIVLTSFYITIKLKNNFFKNFSLSILSIFLIFFVIESVFSFKQKKIIIFNKNESSKLKNKNKSHNISNKKSDDKADFNYVGNKYFTKSKYGFLANPGSYYSTKYSSKGDLIYDVTYLIDKDGFRITPQSHDSNKSLIVNFYGGSFTFGEGVNQNETLPAYFAKLSNKSLHVNNYGFHGWGINNSLSLLEDNLKNKNDNEVNILLTFKEHALRSACKPEYSNFSPKYVIQLNEKKESYVELKGQCRQNFLPLFIYKVLKKSRFYNFVDDRINRRGSLEEEDVKLYYNLIKEFIRVSTKNNYITIVGILPAVNSSDDFLNTMKKFQTNDLIKILDLRLYDFNKREQENIFFLHTEDKHPSPLANLDRAKILLKELNLQ